MRTRTCLALLGAACLLSSCGGFGDSIGFGRNEPDAFEVVDRPPLSLPPTFDLRPPRPGAARPQDVSTSEKASATLFSGSAGQEGEGGDASGAEKALLSSAHTDKAHANIRDVLDREAQERAKGSDKLVEEILWWRKSDGATTVDAEAEAKRLREAKEKGEAVTEGKTPIISKGSSGWLGL